MFKPTTANIKKIADLPNYKKRIKELESFFDKPTIIYIDFANVYQWNRNLHWHIDIHRLKLFLDSFKNIKLVRIYQGTLVDDEPSENFVKQARNLNYDVTTKDVKIMKLSIDVSSIPPNNPAVLENFIKKSLLRKLDLEQIEIMNGFLKKMNEEDIKYIEQRKCNFDVEMGVDMNLDCERGNAENFIVWTGDSDFADPINKLIGKGKKVVIFSLSGKVTKELSETKALIFDIRKIRDFISRRAEMKTSVRISVKSNSIKSKEDLNN